MRWFLPLLAVACAKPAPPTCANSEEFACFAGAFSGLLGKRLEGVKVCAPELDLPCEFSDSDGTWKMPGLPRDTDVLLTATYDDAVDTVFPQTTSMDWYDWYKVMVPQSVMNSNAGRLDVELLPNRGHILFLAWEGLNVDGENTPNVKGVTAEIIGSEGRLFYAGGLGLADASATETSGSGSGGVINLEPGVYEMRFDGPGGPCEEQSFHWSILENGSIPVPVRAGHTTAIDVICPP